MASPGQLTQAVAGMLDLPEPAVAWSYRLLREAGQVSKGGRGKSAATVTARDGAALLIAAMGQLPAKPKLAAWEEYARAKPVRGFMIWCAEKEMSAKAGAWVHSAGTFPGLAALDDDHALLDVIAAMIDEASRGDIRAALEAAFPVPGARTRADITIDFVGPIASATLTFRVVRMNVGGPSDPVFEEYRMYFPRDPTERAIEAGGLQPVGKRSWQVDVRAMQRLGDLIAGRAP